MRTRGWRLFNRKKAPGRRKEDKAHALARDFAEYYFFHNIHLDWGDYFDGAETPMEAKDVLYADAYDSLMAGDTSDLADAICHSDWTEEDFGSAAE